MSSNKAKTVYTLNSSFCSLLGIAFIVLKLTHVIDWSWWFVLMPIYLPFVLVIAFLLILAVIFYFANS